MCKSVLASNELQKCKSASNEHYSLQQFPYTVFLPPYKPKHLSKPNSKYECCCVDLSAVDLAPPPPPPPCVSVAAAIASQQCKCKPGNIIIKQALGRAIPRDLVCVITA